MTKQKTSPILGWSFGLLVFMVGILNLIQVHPVPGLVYLFLALLFLPPVNQLLKRKIGYSIPILVQILLAIVLIMFTLGVSDLAELYGL